ncbi:MAG: hypothetical protein ABR511_01075 [Acidimicrobiales bacterium]
MSFSTDPSSTAGGYDPATRRVLLLFATSLIVIGLGGLVAVTVHGRSRRTASAPGVTAPPTTAGLSAAGLGPEADDDLAAYTANRSVALAAATGDRVAVVSFTSYVPEAQARATVGSLPVTALLAAVPGGMPALVTTSMAEWVDSQAASQRADRDELARLLPTVDDAQFKAFYQQELDRLTKLIASLKPDGPLVFGVAVHGPAPALQALATAPGVRLVDVSPSATVKPGTPERGIRPEEATKANDPPTRPV